MHKADLRKKYKLLRKQLSLEEIEKSSLAIANNCCFRYLFGNYTYYHLFLSIVEQKEVNTEYILTSFSGKR
jgi:5-formyltetrahydrofolate cyclo-ligase